MTDNINYKPNFINYMVVLQITKLVYYDDIDGGRSHYTEIVGQELLK